MVNRTMYAESAGITQVSLNVIYKLRVMKYEIPLTVMTYWNPKSNQGFFYTGMCSSICFDFYRVWGDFLSPS